ncbi:hypothetical protein ISCGN_029538 [Ixodes scapularis]
MKRTCWTLLDLALLALTTMSFASVVLKILMRSHWNNQFTNEWDKMHQNDAADIALAVALVFVTGIVFIRKRKGNPASGYVCVVLGFFFIAAAVDTLELHHQITNNKMTISDISFQEHEVISSVMITVLALGSFLLSGLQDNQTTGTPHQQGAQLISEDNRSPFGVMACVTIYRNFKIVLTAPKDIEEHIPILSKRLRCAPVVKRFNKILCRKTFTWGGRGGPIIFALFSVIWKDVLWMAVVTIAYFICLISRVPVLESLIAGDDSSLTGAYAFLFITTCVAESCLSYYQLHLSLRCGIQIRNMLQTTMFRKMTRLSPTSRALSSSGHLVSVIGVDCQQCSLATIYLPLPVLGLICMPFMFAMLAERVGRVPVICCAAWMVLAVLMPVPISRLQMSLWRKILSGRDQRLKRMADLLTSVRLVKMCAWEDAYMDSVKGFRESEMNSVFRVNLLDGLIDSLYSGTSSMMIILLFGSLAIFDPNRLLSPALSFSCIYMLSLTDTITNNLSQVFRIRCLMSLALERIINFCTQEEEEGKQIGFNYHSQTKGSDFCYR